MSEDTKTLEQQIEGLGDIVVKGMEAANDAKVVAKSTEARLDELIREMKDRRTSLQGGDDLLSLIPENKRHLIHLAEVNAQQWRSAKANGKDGYNIPGLDGRGIQCAFPGDPTLKVAMGLWIGGHLTKLTRPADFQEMREQHDLLTKALNPLNPVHKAAMSELSGGVGGNLVPTIVEAEILRLVADNSMLRPLVRKVPMTTKTHAYPTRNAAFSAAIIAEEGSITDSVPATPFAQSSLTAKKLACFATVSSELMQDNVVLLADYLATEFSEQIGRLEDTQGMEGDGTGVNFTGVVAASGVGSVSSGTNGEFLSYQKLVDTVYTGQEITSRDGGVFFWNPQVEASLLKTRTDAAAAADKAGLPLWAPAGGVQGSPTMTFMGRRFYSHSGILKNRTTGSGTNRTNVYFGPPRTIIFGDLLGFSIDLNPWGKFQTFQIDIRGVKRTGILVAVPAAWTVYSKIDGSGTMIA